MASLPGKAGRSPLARSPDSIFWNGEGGLLSVHHFRAETEVYYEPHTHPEYTLVICLAGAVSLCQYGQTTTIGPGEALLSNGELEHSGSFIPRDGSGCEVINISLQRDRIAELLNDFDLPKWQAAFAPIFLGLVTLPAEWDEAKEMAGELSSSRPGRDAMIATLAVRLFLHIIRLWPRSAIQTVRVQPVARLTRKEFHLAYDFMRSCRKEDFRLNRLCRRLGTSEERFSRLFYNSTGQTPASFYNRLLLGRAQALLRQPRTSIKEVGYEVGFKTSSHFNTAFRREFGMSPLEYRRQAAGHRVTTR